ncbi:MAG: hypothetical protein ACC642_00055 [Pseudomonadales bacterium]
MNSKRRTLFNNWRSAWWGDRRWDSIVAAVDSHRRESEDPGDWIITLEGVVKALEGKEDELSLEAVDLLRAGIAYLHEYLVMTEGDLELAANVVEQRELKVEGLVNHWKESEKEQVTPDAL